jgi:hypothetical protein
MTPYIFILSLIHHDTSFQSIIIYGAHAYLVIDRSEKLSNLPYPVENVMAIFQ